MLLVITLSNKILFELQKKPENRSWHENDTLDCMRNIPQLLNDARVE